MKKFIAVLTAALCLAATALPMSAAADKGNYGDVPLFNGGIEIDAQIDEAYTELGLAVEVAGDYPNIPSESAGTAYFLHDGANLYVAMQIKNSHPLWTDYAKEISEEAWMDDGCEFYIDWNGDGSDMSKWMCWYDGQIIMASNNVSGGLVAFEAAHVDEQTYIMEYQFELTGNAKTGAQIGWYVMINSNADQAAAKQEFIAVPNIMDGIVAANNAAEWANMTLSATEVKLPEPETEAPVEDVVVETAPQTFDAGIIAAVAAIVSAAGYALSKKR